MKLRYHRVLCPTLRRVHSGERSCARNCQPPTGTESVSDNSIGSLLVTQQSGNTVVKVGLKQALGKVPFEFQCGQPGAQSSSIFLAHQIRPVATPSR